jgi:uncharacterized cysteine cluster protein YcgN (CxxCxxCC family)
MKYLEIQFWRIAKWLIVHHYGKKCIEYCEGCGTCDAHKIIEWIDTEIWLIKQ